MSSVVKGLASFEVTTVTIWVLKSPPAVTLAIIWLLNEISASIPLVTSPDLALSQGETVNQVEFLGLVHTFAIVYN